MKIERWGRIDYPTAHARMRAALESRIRGEADDALFLCEHDPVYTLGRRRGAEQNVLDPGGVPVISVERGGDVTFHGPGQVVAYPVVWLPPGRQDLHAWLRGLEDVLIDTLARFGVLGERDARNTGVWVGGRKIGAIGVACRSWVTWHGVALNVTTDLDHFRRIHPCGLDSALTTRLADHLDPCPALDAVGDTLAQAFESWWSAQRSGLAEASGSSGLFPKSVALQ